MAKKFGDHKISPRIATLTVNGEKEMLLVCRCNRGLTTKKGKLVHAA